MTHPVDPETLLSHREFIRALVRPLVDDPSSVDDVEQSTWAAALSRPPRRPDTLRSWLGTVAKNFALHLRRDEHRRELRQEAAASAEAVPSTEEVLAREAVRRHVVEAVLALAEPYRAAVLLRYFSDLPPRDIARRLDLPVDTVKTRLKRAHDQLRLRLSVTLDTRDEQGRGTSWMAALLPLAAPRPGPGAAIGSAAQAAASAFTAALPALGAGVVIAIAVLGAWLWQRENSLPHPPAEAPLVAESAPQPRPAPAGPSQASRVAVPDAPRGPDAAPAPPSAAASAPVLDRLEGVVLDPDGAPFAGARIEVRRLVWRDFIVEDPQQMGRETLLAAGESDAEGRFAFALPRHVAVDVHAIAADFPPAEMLDRVPGEFVTVSLRRGASLEGIVTRRRDAMPVAGATVRVTRFGPSRNASVAVTDEQGFYRFEGLPPERVRVEVEPREALAVGRARGVLLTAGELVRCDVVLDAGATVTGRITDAVTGEPIPGALLAVNRSFDRAVASDANGQYTLRGFSGSEVESVYCRADGYGEQARVIASPDPSQSDEQIDFALSRSRTARGRIVDPDGEPLADAYVAAVAYAKPDRDWQSAVTASDGTFTVRDLRPDMRHALLIRREPFAITVFDFPLGESNAEDVDLGTLHVHRARRVEGTVVDTAGAPLENVRVSLKGANDDRTQLSGADAPLFTGYGDDRETISDSLGRFAFALVAPGTYALGARILDSEVRIESSLAVTEARDETGLRLTLDPRESITGSLFDTKGEPVAGRIRVFSAPVPGTIQSASTTVAGEKERDAVGSGEPDLPQLATVARVIAREDGAFQVVGLEPGSYVLEATVAGEPLPDGTRGPDRVARLGPIPAGARDVRIVVGE